MTKGEVIATLESYIQKEKLTLSPDYSTAPVLSAYQLRNANILKAMDLLASMHGWNTQRCMRQGSNKPKRRTDNG